MFTYKLLNVISIYIALNNEILKCDNKLENNLQANATEIEVLFIKYDQHHVSQLKWLKKNSFFLMPRTV